RKSLLSAKKARRRLYCRSFYEQNSERSHWEHSLTLWQPTTLFFLFLLESVLHCLAPVKRSPLTLRPAPLLAFGLRSYITSLHLALYVRVFIHSSLIFSWKRNRCQC